MTIKARLAAGEVLAGTWVKTPHPHVVEVLALSPLDLLVIDAEHAPFDRRDIDAAILSARSGGKPVLVRPPSADPGQILNALDCGADGVIIPHIRTPEDAAAAVSACHYGPAGPHPTRGFAGSSRAARYTTLGMAGHRAAAAGVTVIAQIEDADALPQLDAIAATPGLDALFIGRADLTVSLGCASSDDAPVVAAVEAICAAGRKNGCPVGMFLARSADIAHWREKGATLFILASDQEFLLQGAEKLAKAVHP